jgi:hypothetical protein
MLRKEKPYIMCLVGVILMLKPDLIERDNELKEFVKRKCLVRMSCTSRASSFISLYRMFFSPLIG